MPLVRSLSMMIAAEGAMRPLPINNIYHVPIDLTNKSMKAKFYQRNGPLDSETGKNTSIFPPNITFKMGCSIEK
ncbi:MAG: hypothetical protein A4E49_03291 [Methanosaeta sp. PtaU1.Bin112]|nr:MAG: hypothetical protein A4E49_03291 [Methanosaeta sp. PtaU1.Bin112]